MRYLDLRTRCLAGFFVALSLTACGDGTGPSVDTVGTVTVSASQTELSVGGTVQLVATVLNQTGAAMPGQQVAWSSSSESVASVNAGGLVTGIAGGTAVITASSGGKSGSMTLRVLPAQCSASTSSSIALGQSRTGTLSESDCLFIHGAYADGYTFSLSSRTTLRIALSSRHFDALVVITDPRMNVIAWDDDGGGGTNSLLIGAFPAGNYILWATSFFPDSTGAYELSIQGIEAASCTAPVGSLAVGQTVNGILTHSDCLLENGSFADPWELTLSAQTSVQVDLMSNEFDTFLFVTDQSGTWIASDDDGGEGLNSRLVRTLAAGRYLIWATSYGPGATGSYRLSLQAVASGSRDQSGTGAAAGTVLGLPLDAVLLREKSDPGERIGPQGPAPAGRIDRVTAKPAGP